MAKRDKRFLQWIKHPDPVVRVGVEIQSLSERFQDLDSKRASVGGDVHLQSEMDHLSDREEALRDYLSTLRAASVQGAAVQADELIKVLDSYCGSIYHDDGSREAAARKMKRLIYSIKAALREECAAGRTLPGSNDDLDPFLESNAAAAGQ